MEREPRDARDLEPGFRRGNGGALAGDAQPVAVARAPDPGAVLEDEMTGAVPDDGARRRPVCLGGPPLDAAGEAGAVRCEPLEAGKVGTGAGIREGEGDRHGDVPRESLT